MKTMSLIMNGNKYLASFLIFYSVLCSANSEIPDFKARYLFESERFDFQGVRELKTVDDQRIFSFDDDSSLIKAEFKSKFIDGTSIKSLSYDANFRFTFFRRFSSLIFDWDSLILSSKGQNEWEASLNDEVVYDPLNVQVRIRQLLKQGKKEFQLLLPELKNGEIRPNNYEVIDQTTYELNGKVYDCLIIKRIRPEEDRITTYVVAIELDFLMMQITDDDPDGKIKLSIKELLSFG